MECLSTPVAFAWPKDLGALLAGGESWLMERVLAYARGQDFAAATSTLVEPWRASIAGLTKAVVAALDGYGDHPHTYSLSPRTDDPVAAFVVFEAKRHRARGVALPMFWGLLKFHRRAYLDLLSDRLTPGEDRDAALAFVAECFDRMEGVLVREAAELSERVAFDDLGRENRRLTKDKIKYLAVFESIPHPVFLLDDRDRVENCNTAALNLAGHCGPTGTLYYAAAEGESDRACQAVLDRPLAELLPWLEPSLSEVGQAGADRVRLETTVGSGEQACYYNAIIVRLHDVSGTFTGKVVLCRDVTTQRRTEIALAQSEERYRTLVDIMHQGLVIVSPEGRIDFANETLAEMLGCPLSELVGQMAAAFIRAEDRQRFTDALASRQSGGAEPYEMALLRRDGRSVFVMSSPSPIIGQDGDYQGSFEVLTDVSQLKQLELQLLTAKRLEAIGHLAGGVAHEINTPLQYVSGNLDFAMTNLPRIIELLGKYEDSLRLAEDGQPLVTARQDIEAFRREHDLEMVLAELPQALSESQLGAERVAAFVRSIKRFAQTEGIGRRAIDVNEAILATVEMAKSAFESQVCLETDLAEDLPPLLCVPGDFNQLLLCLLLNAADAVRQTDPCSGCVRVASQLDGPSVAVSVSDTGPGIPPEIQDKIFNPFFSTKGVGKGSGQGLSIALSIVQKHKGTIRFVSDPGKGTVFHVNFPLEQTGE